MRNFQLPVFVIFILGAFVSAAHAIRQDRWEWLSPTPNGYTVTDLAFGVGVHVAVTYDGHILNSTDGVEWRVVYDGNFLYPLRRVKYLRQAFYAVGDRGSILRSNDGQNWTVVYRSETGSLRGIVDASVLTVIGTTGELLTSFDGFIWTKAVAHLTPAPYLIYDLAYGNGVYVAPTITIGYNGPARCYRSADGRNWSVVEVPTIAQSNYVNELSSVEFGGGQFIAVGGRHDIARSTDGITWTVNNQYIGDQGIAPKAVRYIAGKWYISGFSGTLQSTDGIAWTRGISGGLREWNGISFGNGRFVAAGRTGGYAYSADGATWTVVQKTSVYNPFTAIAYGLGQFHAGTTYGQIYSSADGRNWSSFPEWIGGWVQEIYADSSIVIAAGSSGSIAVSRTPGVWTKTTLEPEKEWRGVVRWKGKFWIFGSSHGKGGVAYNSTDATTWTAVPMPSSFEPLDAAASEESLVIVGNNGILHTTDGVNFTNVADSLSISFKMFFAIERFRGEYYAVGHNGAVRHSADGITWSKPTYLLWYEGEPQSEAVGDPVPLNIEMGGSNTVTDFCVIEDRLYAGGGTGAFATTDGKSWEISEVPFAAMATDGTRVVAVGQIGGILSRRAAGNGKLINISVRATLPMKTAGEPLILGTYVAGGPATVLARVAGVSLVPMGVGTPATDPTLTLYHGGTAGASNDQWGSVADLDVLRARSAQVGAFSLVEGSKESALLTEVPAGPTTVHVVDQGESAGVGLAELFAADDQTASGTIVNVSARATVGTGENVLIAGFVIAGGQATVLVRGMGPGLKEFGLPEALSTTRISVHNGVGFIAANDAWNYGHDAAEIRHYQRMTGAHPFAEGSRDSCLLLTLPPGLYTAILSSPSGQVGTGLVEVYLVNP